jgi:hypothetical protein
MDWDERQKIVQELAEKRFLVNTPVVGRANSLEEKTKILNRLAAVWEANPDLRLAQLIVNAWDQRADRDQPADIYHVEDFPLVEGIEEFYEHRKTL